MCILVENQNQWQSVNAGLTIATVCMLTYTGQFHLIICSFCRNTCMLRHNDLAGPSSSLPLPFYQSLSHSLFHSLFHSLSLSFQRSLSRILFHICFFLFV